MNMVAPNEVMGRPADRGGRRFGPVARSWGQRTWPSVAVLVGGLVVWQLVVQLGHVSTFVIAKPTAFLAEAWQSRGILAEATWVTTQEILYGFAISVVCGVAIALLVERFAWLYRATYPLIVLFQVVPKVALAPIFILWFGYGLAPRLVLIVVIAFFPITLNMVVGLKNVDGDLLVLMRSVGSSDAQVLWRIRVPTSLPYLFAGLRIAITFAVIGAVVAEFAGAKDGLGYLIQFASTQLDTPLMFAALVVVSVLGLVLYYALSLVELGLSRRFPHIRFVAQ